MKENISVDNILTGIEDIESGQKLCQDLNNILATAQMKLRQWASNEPLILKDINPEDIDKNYTIYKDFRLKTPGIVWNAARDMFIYTTKHLPTNVKLTKRYIISEIAEIFDPSGLLGPIILYAKIIMQDIWNAKINWDEEVP